MSIITKDLLDKFASALWDKMKIKVSDEVGAVDTRLTETINELSEQLYELKQNQDILIEKYNKSRSKKSK